MLSINSSLDQRLKKVEEIINKGDEFLKKLDAVDAITVENAFNNIQLLTNRFDQIEQRFNKIEDYVNTLNVEQMKIMNEISKSKVEQEKINEIGSKLETLNDYQQKTNNEISKMQSNYDQLKNELNITRWIAIGSLLLSTVLFFIIITNQ